MAVLLASSKTNTLFFTVENPEKLFSVELTSTICNEKNNIKKIDIFFTTLFNNIN